MLLHVHKVNSVLTSHELVRVPQTLRYGLFPLALLYCSTMAELLKNENAR